MDKFLTSEGALIYLCLRLHVTYTPPSVKVEDADDVGYWLEQHDDEDFRDDDMHNSVYLPTGILYNTKRLDLAE